MKNKKGFTLVEMLATVVILAILIGIAVPAYNAYINNSRKNAYKTAEQSLVKSGTTAVLDCVNDKGSDFCKDKRMPQDEYEYTIFTLEELIENGYMDDVKDPKDDSKHCDEKQSYVYIRKNSEEASGGYTYESCLVCDGYKSETCREGVLDQEDYSFETICKIAYDPAGTNLWDGKWTDQDLYLVVSVAGDYRFGISRFDYKKNSGSYQKLALETESTYLKISDDTSGDTYRIKAQDGQKRTSETVCHGALSTDTNIKIDKTIIEGVTVTGKLTSGTAVTSDTWAKADDGKVVLTANPNPSTIRSGYKYQWYKNGEIIEGATEKTYTATLRGTYKVVITNDVSTQFKEASFVVKIDKDEPECKLQATATTGSLVNGWYTGDVTISFEETIDIESSDSMAGSGIASQTLSHTSISSNTSTSGTTVTGTVKDNVGRTNTCTVVVKRDGTTPTITAKSNPISLGSGAYTFTSNVTVSYGPASGTTTCDPASTKKTGSYTVTCTATGNNGKTKSVSFTARHSYSATRVSKTCSGTRNCQNTYCCTGTPGPCQPWICDACWGSQVCSVNCGYQVNSQCCEPSSPCTQCEHYTYDCSYYTCPNGGTLSGSTCNY